MLTVSPSLHLAMASHLTPHVLLLVEHGPQLSLARAFPGGAYRMAARSFAAAPQAVLVRASKDASIMRHTEATPWSFYLRRPGTALMPPLA